MRIAIVVDAYSPQDFFERQAQGLGADIVATHCDSSVTSESMLTNGRRYNLYPKGPELERFVGKVARRLAELISDGCVPPWPAQMRRLFERYVRERKPDVVLAQFAPNGLQALEACRRHGIPLVVHFHGYDASSLLRHKGYVAQLPELFRYVAAVVAVSKQMAATLVSVGCPERKLSIIPCGAPVNQLWPVAKTRDDCGFVTVGRLIAVKGPLLALRAFAYCRRRVESGSLTIIGDGPLQGPAMRLAKRLKIFQEVAFLGRQPFSVVIRELGRNHVFLQHSVTTKLGQVEGWGVAAAEAQAGGLPVIATDHGGLRDQIIDGYNGFLIPEGDWRQMGECMIQLARDPDLRERMGSAARHRIEKIGDSAQQVEKLRVVLKRAYHDRIDAALSI